MSTPACSLFQLEQKQITKHEFLYFNVPSHKLFSMNFSILSFILSFFSLSVSPFFNLLLCLSLLLLFCLSLSFIFFLSPYSSHSFSCTVPLKQFFCLNKNFFISFHFNRCRREIK